MPRSTSNLSTRNLNAANLHVTRSARLTAHLVALTALSSASLAGWGVRYEVNAGSGWSSAATIDVSGGPKTVDFRISVFIEGTMMINTPKGLSPAVAPLRLCNSQKLTNFGDPASGDSVLQFTKTVLGGNSKALERSLSGSDTILGVPNSIFSFSANTDALIPHPVQFEKQFYFGTIRVGNGTPNAMSRTITLTANSFSFPGAPGGSGGTYGGSFFVVVNGQNSNGPATEPGVAVPATITVQLPCPADLDGNRLVDDADFVLFDAAHNLADCSDPSMAPGCPADLNSDGFVDDDDFVIFAAAYAELMCD